MTPAEVFAPQWLEGLEKNAVYRVRCDDEPTASLQVIFSNDADVWVQCVEGDGVEEPFSAAGVRIRTYAGGGRSERTRQALLWLALAIKLDNTDNPRPGRPATTAALNGP